jgi:hypothetical protein
MEKKNAISLVCVLLPVMLGLCFASCKHPEPSGAGEPALFPLVRTVTPVPLVQEPYPAGTPWPVPGMIQAENYDLGGEGVAYHDESAGNDGVDGDLYRTDDVDIHNSGAPRYLHLVQDGEWLEYTIDVPVGGIYNIDLRVGPKYPGSALTVFLDGVDVSGKVDLTVTGSYTGWTLDTVSGIAFTAGQHILKIHMVEWGFTFDYIDIN